MYIVAGLGNPGEKYSKTRHNVGMIILDSMGNLIFENDKYAEGKVFFDKFLDREIIFLKSNHFMNDSGISINHLSKKFSVQSHNIIVIHDEIDLPLGVIRLSFDRGSGGHNGVKSVIDQIGANSFLRIRVGIAPTDKEGRAIKPKTPFFSSSKNATANFVLKDFGSADLEKIKSLAPKVREIIETVVRDGYKVAMNKFN